MKPLVLLDVDGVINALNREVSRTHEMMGYPIRIPVHMPGLIRHLTEVAEVHWCTTWREEANKHLAPVLGIEPLPVVTDGTDDRFVGWKWHAAIPVVDAALEARRKVCWIEDFEGSHSFRSEGRWRYVDFVDTTRQGLYYLTNEQLPSYLRKD